MTLIGYSLVILSMLLFPVSYALFKVASPYLTNTLIIFFQSLVSWLLIAPFAIRRGIATKHFPLILLRTAFGLISLYCISMAIRMTEISIVVLFNNTAPLFVPFILWIWFKTKVQSKIWVSLSIGFLGVLLILRPGFQSINPGLLLALLSGISSAHLLVVTRQIAHESFIKILFYYFMIFCFVLSPFLLADWTSPPAHIWAVIGLSGITMIGAQLAFTAGLRYVPSHEAAPFIYSAVIFSGLIDWIFWKEAPDLLSILGMVVVFSGGLMAILANRKKTA
jgi:drug/metabolite transporter (DMT)-like permease